MAEGATPFLTKAASEKVVALLALAAEVEAPLPLSSSSSS
jgi:hypothetical protein